VAALLGYGNTAFAQADASHLLAAARREGIRLAQSSAPAPKQDESWIVRHPVAFGTLVGTGAGAAIFRDPRGALIGAGAGAWGGLIGSAVHQSHTKHKVGVGTKIGIAAGAATIVVLSFLTCYGAGGCGGVS
jgi:hypothetical protein